MADTIDGLHSKDSTFKNATATFLRNWFFSLRNKAGFVRKTCWKGLSCVDRKVYCFEWDFEAQVLIENLIRCDNLQKRFKRRECHLDCLLRLVQIQIRDLRIKTKIEVGKKVAF